MKPWIRRSLIPLLPLIASLAACRDAPEAPTTAAATAPEAPLATGAAAPAPGPASTTDAAAPPIRPGLVPRLHLRPPPVRALLTEPHAQPTPPAGNPATGTTAPPGSPADDSPPAATPERPSPVRRIEVHAIDAAEGEDGRGNVVPAVRPVAIDLHADAWGGRGLDPILAAGDLEFRRYQHPGPGVLRFVAADADALPAGRPVWLRWGDRERFRVTDSLEVPR